MEKYRKFADPGTSCNPFLPVNLVTPIRENRALALLRMILYSPLVIVRVPIAGLCLLLIGLADLLALVPIVSTFVIIPLVRPVLAWLALLSIGVSSDMSATADSSRRKRMQSGGSTNSPAEFTLSTFHGFVDVLVHSVITHPTAFVFPSLAGNLIVCRSILCALRVACQSSSTTPPPSSPSSTPVPRGSVIFVSPVPTNGLGIMTLDSAILSPLIEGKQIQLTALQYSVLGGGQHYPHHLTESPFTHVLKLMTESWMARSAITTLVEPITTDSMELIKQHLCRLAKGAADTKLNPASYIEFLKYWHATQSRTYAVVKTE